MASPDQLQPVAVQYFIASWVVLDFLGEAFAGSYELLFCCVASARCIAITECSEAL
jgi:hypothetical protein